MAPRPRIWSYTHVYTVRKGKIFGVEFFSDHAEALEAVRPLGVGDVAGERGYRFSLRCTRGGARAIFVGDARMWLTHLILFLS